MSRSRSIATGSGGGDSTRRWRSGVVARESGLPCDPFLLSRVKHTRQQVGLTKAQRQQNLQGAFRVSVTRRRASRASGLLLVDDVLTTGATANAASRALLRGGAVSVDILAFARVVTER